MYSALKYKYNLFKKLVHNKEVMQYSFIATRDWRILSLALKHPTYAESIF